MGFQVAQLAKESACQSAGDGVQSWVKNIPWRRKGQPTLVLLQTLWTEEPGGLHLHVITKSRTLIELTHTHIIARKSIGQLATFLLLAKLD